MTSNSPLSVVNMDMELRSSLSSSQRGCQHCKELWAIFSRDHCTGLSAICAREAMIP